MKHSPSAALVLSVTLFLQQQQSVAGEFGYGFANSRNDQLTLKVPRAPKQFLNARNVQVNIFDKTNGYSDAGGLKVAIERVLSREFTISPSGAQIAINVQISAFEAPIARLTTMWIGTGQPVPQTQTDPYGGSSSSQGTTSGGYPQYDPNAAAPVYQSAPNTAPASPNVQPAPAENEPKAAPQAAPPPRPMMVKPATPKPTLKKFEPKKTLPQKQFLPGGRSIVGLIGALAEALLTQRAFAFQTPQQQPPPAGYDPNTPPQPQGQNPPMYNQPYNQQPNNGSTAQGGYAGICAGMTSDPDATQTAGGGTQQTVQIPVELWQGCGRLALTVEAIEIATNRSLGGFSPEQGFRQQVRVSVNGADQMDRTQLPTGGHIYQHIVNSVLKQVDAQYLHGVEEAKVRLAADEPLRPINKLFMGGQIQAALDQFQKVQLTKFPGDRLHNIAVAYEALAYESYLNKRTMVTTIDLFNKAVIAIREAAQADPKEKYIQMTLQRISAVRNSTIEPARLNFMELSRTSQERQQQAAVAQEQAKLQAAQQADQARQQEQLQAQQAEAQRLQEEAAAKAQEAELRSLQDPRPDTPKEVPVRSLVRLRMRTQAAPLSTEELTKLEALGATFQLEALASKRLVYQEHEKWARIYPAMLTYKETFDVLNADKRVTAEERTGLDALAAQLQLSKEEVTTAESGSLPAAKK